MTSALTCTGVSIGQLWRDGDFPALIHTHALQTFVHPRNEPTLPDQADFSCSFLMAVKETKERHKWVKNSERAASAECACRASLTESANLLELVNHYLGIFDISKCHFAATASLCILGIF